MSAQDDKKGALNKSSNRTRISMIFIESLYSFAVFRDG